MTDSLAELQRLATAATENDWATVIITTPNFLRLVRIAQAAEKRDAAFNEFAEFVTSHNREKDVPWPIAELFVRTYRAALREALGEKP